jgi:gluconate kinase
MSSALLSVLLVCNRRVIQQHDVDFDRSACYALCDGNQIHSVSNVKKINHGLPLCQNNTNGV